MYITAAIYSGHPLGRPTMATTTSTRIKNLIHVPYSTEITPTLIACYKGGMGLISKTVVLPQNYAHS